MQTTLVFYLWEPPLGKGSQVKSKPDEQVIFHFSRHDGLEAIQLQLRAPVEEPPLILR